MALIGIIILAILTGLAIIGVDALMSNCQRAKDCSKNTATIATKVEKWHRTKSIGEANEICEELWAILEK